MSPDYPIEMSVEGAKKVIWSFLSDCENDGFPLVFVDPEKGKGKHGRQTLIPDSRLQELKDAICFLDDEYYYMCKGD
jgi:hypothetical protein